MTVNSLFSFIAASDELFSSLHFSAFKHHAKKRESFAFAAFKVTVWSNGLIELIDLDRKPTDGFCFCLSVKDKNFKRSTLAKKAIQWAIGRYKDIYAHHKRKV